MSHSTMAEPSHGIFTMTIMADEARICLQGLDRSGCRVLAVDSAGPASTLLSAAQLASQRSRGACMWLRVCAHCPAVHVVWHIRASKHKATLSCHQA